MRMENSNALAKICHQWKSCQIFSFGLNKMIKWPTCLPVHTLHVHSLKIFHKTMQTN